MPQYQTVETVRNWAPDGTVLGMRKTPIGPAPYEVELVHDDQDRIVAVNIRTVRDGAELDFDTVKDATRSLLDYFKHYRPSVEAHEAEPPLRAIPDFAEVRAMVAAYDAGHGRVTDQYLARLAVAYAELVPEGRGVSTALADALDKPLSTVKGHIMRARREGFLTDAVEGREGGEPTAKARELLDRGISPAESKRLGQT